jgi:hypothetical protein
MGRGGGRVMPALAIADFLTDFGSPVREEARPLRLAVPQPKPGIDPAEVEIRIAQAVAEAEAATSARHQAQWLVDRADLESRHAAELAALRAELGENSAQLITARFTALEQALIEQTGGVVARILGAILTEQMQTRSVETLTAALRSALADRETVRLRVSGPAFMHEALMERIGPLAESIEFIETDAVDLTVAVDDALYATRLGDWSAELAQVLA